MSPSQPPDRLAAILAELDEGRRTPWLPQENELIDRRPLLARRRRRSAGNASELPVDQGLASLGFGDDADDLDEIEEAPPGGFVDQPRSRSERRSRARAGQVTEEPLRPHTPLFRSPLPDTDIESRPGRSALIGALVVLVIAALVFGFRVWSARQQATPTPLTVPATASVTGRAGASGAATAPGAGVSRASGKTTGTNGGGPAASSSAGFVLVHVVGQVRKPGVVRLPAGSRVNDAIKAAGGATPAADLSAVNLARPLGDGEQVHVPKPGETPPPIAGPVGPGSTGTGQSGTGQGTGQGSTAGAAGTAPVNLNTATEAELDTLPGVGPVLAARIVTWRTTNGRFASVDDLGEVSGIGDKLLDQLRPRVTV